MSTREIFAPVPGSIRQPNLWTYMSAVQQQHLMPATDDLGRYSSPRSQNSFISPVIFTTLSSVRNTGRGMERYKDVIHGGRGETPLHSSGFAGASTCGHVAQDVRDWNIGFAMSNFSDSKVSFLRRCRI